MQTIAITPNAVPQEVPLSLLIESATNPRQHFEEDDLNELAETIRKSGVYLECLKHYNDTVDRKRSKEFLEAPTAALGVRALFKDILESLDNPETPSVICMMAGSLTHEVLDEAELRQYIEGRISTLQDAMLARMRADKRDGLLAEGFEPEFVVPVVHTYMQGLWRMALVSYERTRFERQIDVFLTGLGL